MVGGEGAKYCFLSGGTRSPHVELRGPLLSFGPFASPFSVLEFVMRVVAWNDIIVKPRVSDEERPPPHLPQPYHEIWSSKQTPHPPQVITPKTANRPTPSSHPTTKCNLMNNTLCSKYLICSLLIKITSGIVLPNNFSQARVLQSSLPVAIQPVSSTRRPMMRGLRDRERSLSQLWQGVVSLLAYMVTPQLFES